jgi:hypothetical protein
MSVASLSGYLANGGSGGDTFNTITLGNTNTVELGCTTENELYIAGGTAATREWVDANYVVDESDATLQSLKTIAGITSGTTITIKGGTGNGVLSVNEDGTQLLFNGQAVQLVT